METDDEENTIAMAKAHRTFAIICVTYLSFGVFESGFCETEAEFIERQHLNQLYSYAAHSWGYHAREASTYCPSIKCFLLDSPKVEASSQALLANESLRSPKRSQSVPRRVTGLHLAAYIGIEDTVRMLLKDWQDIDQKDSHSQTPLMYAAESGYESIVRLLLAMEKVDVNAKDHYGWTPLSIAAMNGHKSIVELLLATGKVHADAEDAYGRTPLCHAAQKGHEAIVKLLLLTDKVHVGAKDVFGQTPLSYAARNGHEAIVKLLLATKQVDVNVKSLSGRTPLRCAANNGHEGIVKLLLAAEKADANAKNGSSRTDKPD
ncbi:hypothetical protein MY4824_005905 [Beauveria thailandica]